MMDGLINEKIVFLFLNGLIGPSVFGENILLVALLVVSLEL